MVATGMGGDSNVMEVVFQGDANDLNEAAESASNRLLTLRKVAGLASAAVAGLGLYGFAKAASAAAEFESQMVEVEKVTNPETAREMGHAIRDMAEELPVAHEELAQIAADAGRFGLEGSQNIQNFTRTVSKMAVATNLSAQDAGESLARLAELTDTPTDRVENLGSVINILSNNAATSSDEIVDSMLRSSAALSQVGLQQDEIAALGSALNEVSESSQRAGTRLRRVGQELMNPKRVEDLSTAMGMTADEFKNMRDESPLKLIVSMAEAMRDGGEAADGLRTTLATPTRQALAGLGQNLDGVTESLAQATSEMDDAESLQREFNAASDTFNARVQVTKNRFRNLAQTTGDSMLPALTDVLGIVNSAVNGFNQLNEATDGLIGQLTLLGVVAGGAAGAVSLLGLGAGGPVAMAIIGIGALAAAYSHNMAGIRDSTIRTAEAIDESLTAALRNMGDTADTELDKGLSAWQTFEIHLAQGIDMIMTELGNMGDVVITVVGHVVDQLGVASKAIMLLLQNRHKEARDFLKAEAEEDQLQKFEDMQERIDDRHRDLEARTNDRQVALDLQDKSFLPANKGDDPKGTPRWKKDLDKSQEKWRKERENWEKKRQDWRNEMSDLMSQNKDVNTEAATAMKQGPMSSRKSLKDALLDPFERAQPDCFQVENPRDTAQAQGMETAHDNASRIKQQIQTLMMRKDRTQSDVVRKGLQKKIDQLRQQLENPGASYEEMRQPDRLPTADVTPRSHRLISEMSKRNQQTSTQPEVVRERVKQEQLTSDEGRSPQDRQPMIIEVDGEKWAELRQENEDKYGDSLVVTE